MKSWIRFKVRRLIIHSHRCIMNYCSQRWLTTLLKASQFWSNACRHRKFDILNQQALWTHDSISLKPFNCWKNHIFKRSITMHDHKQKTLVVFIFRRNIITSFHTMNFTLFSLVSFNIQSNNFIRSNWRGWYVRIVSLWAWYFAYNKHVIYHIWIQ